MSVCFEFNYQIFFFTTVIVIEIYIGFIYVQSLATVCWFEVEVVVMAMPVVEFLREGYKIRKVFG